MNRRIFIEGLGAFSVVSFAGCVTHIREAPVVRFGAVTDIHYADHDPDPRPLGVIGQRFYRESCRKLKEAVAVFNERKLDFAIELGDFKDLSADKASTIAHLGAAMGAAMGSP